MANTVGGFVDRANAKRMQDQVLANNKPLSWDQALAQATQQLSPIYDKQLPEIMRQSDKDLISRGLYGQLPGDALGQSRRWDVLNDKQTAINNLAAQTQGMSQQNALNAYQMAMQNALGQSNMRTQAFPGQFNAWKDLSAWDWDDIVAGLNRVRASADKGQSVDVFTLRQ